MSTGTHEASERVTPRTVYVGLWAVAAVGYTGFLLIGRGPAAVVTFAVFSVVALLYGRFGGVRFDERDAAIYESASARTVQVVGIVSAVVFPSLVVAASLGYYEWSPFVGGVGTAVAGIFGLWVVLIVFGRS